MKDGEEYIKWENGYWDNFWGYHCRKCGIMIGETEGAFNHENNCKGEREKSKDGKYILWKGR